MARLTSCGASRTLPPQMNALALLALLMAAMLGSSSAVLRRSPTYTYQSRTNLTQLWQLSLDSCAMWVGTNAAQQLLIFGLHQHDSCSTLNMPLTQPCSSLLHGAHEVHARSPTAAERIRVRAQGGC